MDYPIILCLVCSQEAFTPANRARCQSRPNEPFDLDTDTDSEEAILTEEHIKIAQRLASEVAFPDDLQELPG